MLTVKLRSHIAILLAKSSRLLHTILQKNTQQNRSDFAGVFTPSKHFRPKIFVYDFVEL